MEPMVFPAENIRDWRTRDVVDQAGDKIGSLESLYFDTGTDQAEFASVRVGVLTHRLTFVPLAGAVVSPTYLKVQVDKKVVKDAPSIDLDGELTREDEPALFAHYNIPYTPGAGGERRLGRR
jgi:hypothetical protein